MPYFPPTHTPTSPGPVDGVGLVIFLVVLAVIVVAAGAVALWLDHRHGDQQRHSHQH